MPMPDRIVKAYDRKLASLGRRIAEMGGLSSKVFARQSEKMIHLIEDVGSGEQRRIGEGRNWIFACLTFSPRIRESNSMILNSALVTGLYQLTVTQVYLASGQTDVAVFEFFIRKMPNRRNFFVCAGLETVIDFVKDFTFSQEDIDWLKRTNQFDAATLQYLANFHFTGDVDAVPTSASAPSPAAIRARVVGRTRTSRALEGVKLCLSTSITLPSLPMRQSSRLYRNSLANQIPYSRPATSRPEEARAFDAPSHCHSSPR